MEKADKYTKYNEITRYKDVNIENIQIGYAIGLIYKDFLKKYQARLRKKFDLNESEADILMLLYHNNKMLTPKELSEKLFFTTGGITRLLKSMEKKGLIIRLASEEDARSKLVKIEKKGDLLINKIETEINELAHGHFNFIDEEKKKTLLKTLQEVTSTF